jgi:hypothetical protein
MSAQELPTTPAPEPSAPTPRSGGRYLTLDRVSQDGRRLVLVDAAGMEFTVEVDARLRAVLTEKPDRRMEPQMDSVLRPRDIQARVRAGESPESVAATAQTTVDKVMPYAAPVLAEREHVAERAQKSSLRRTGGEPGSARTLGEAVGGRIRAMNIDPAEVMTWDAWRREDGRWALTGRFSVRGREGMAEFTFDPPGNFVVLDNDDARWLVGDLPDAPEPLAADPTQPPRLSAVRDAPADEQLELGDDIIGLVTDRPIEAFLDDQPGLDESELVEEAADAAALDPDPVSDPEATSDHPDEPPSRRPVRKTRGRASVPSWDEIMFGGPTD